MLDRLVAAAVLVTFVACARPVPREPVVAHVNRVPAAPAVAPPAFAAIALNEKQSVELTADGSMLDVKPTTRLAVGRRVFTLKSDAANDTYVCDVGHDPTKPFHGEGTFHTEGLSLLDPYGNELVLVHKNEHVNLPDALVFDEHSASVVGAVGRYVFVRERRNSYQCGGEHPMLFTEPSIWDVEQRKLVTLRPPMSVFEKAVTALAGRGFNDQLIKFAEATPSFDAEGHLSIVWRFQKPTSYVDGDHLGDDYTISATIESDDLPEELAAYREPPVAIRNYLANGGEPIIGYTSVD